MRSVLRSVVTASAFFIATGLVIVSAPNNGAGQPEPVGVSMPAVDFIETAHAQATCGEGGYRCGDLAQNGTCCNNADHCCTVSVSRGSCYCVAQGNSCGR